MPVKVTVSVVPVTPVAGLTALKVATGAVTVNGRVTVCPPTVRPNVVVAAVAVEAITMFAVTALGLEVTIEPLMPASPPTNAVAPDRFVPLKVTVRFVPAAALAGLREVSVGAAALTRNGNETVLPPMESPSVVAPVVAVEAMVMLALTEVALADEIEPVMPVSPATTALAPERLVPVKVTVNVVPAAPLAGLSSVSVGAAAVTVNGSDTV